MKDTELKAIREEKRKAVERQDIDGKQEWTAREIAWLEEHIEKAPSSVRRMRSLLALLKREERQAKRDGDFSKVEEYREKEEALENRMLAIQPENQTILRDLRKRIRQKLQEAIEAGDEESIARYEAQRDAIEKRGEAEIKHGKETTVENESDTLAKARNLIYANEDIFQVAEEIKVLMEGAETADLNFLLAELYFHTGFTQRAQKFLKAYKRELSASGKSVKLVNLGLAVVLNSKTNKFNWDEFWRKKAELDRQERMAMQGEKER